jgi:hypothetical protein
MLENEQADCRRKVRGSPACVNPSNQFSYREPSQPGDQLEPLPKFVFKRDAGIAASNENGALNNNCFRGHRLLGTGYTSAALLLTQCPVAAKSVETAPCIRRLYSVA